MMIDGMGRGGRVFFFVLAFGYPWLLGLGEELACSQALATGLWDLATCTALTFAFGTLFHTILALEGCSGT